MTESRDCHLSSFLLAFMLAVPLSWAAVGTGYLAVDARDEFGTTLFPPLVRTTRTELEEKLDLVATASPQAIAMGSSTVMRWPSSSFAPLGYGQAFNFGFSSATPAEMTALLDFLPKDVATIIVGLDTHMIIHWEEENRVNKLFSDAPLSIASRIASAMVAPLDATYRDDTLRSFLGQIFGEIRPLSTQFDSSGRLLKDGALSFSKEDRAASEASYLQYVMGRDFDERSWADVEALVQRLPPEVEIHIIYQPVNPSLQANLGVHAPKWDAAVEEIRARLPTLCRPHVAIYDVYGLALTMSNSDWLDYDHYSPEATEIVVAALANNAICRAWSNE